MSSDLLIIKIIKIKIIIKDLDRCFCC